MRQEGRNECQHSILGPARERTLLSTTHIDVVGWSLGFTEHLRVWIHSMPPNTVNSQWSEQRRQSQLQGHSGGKWTVDCGLQGSGGQL